MRRNGFLDGNKTGVIEWKNTASEVVGNVKIETVFSTDIDKTPLAVLRGGVLSSGDSAEQRIELTTTDCNYGKFRYWFICPVVKDGIFCGNRAAKLYLPPAGQYFGCRECYDLTYESCQKSHKYDRVLDHIPENMDLSGLNVNQLLRLASL